VPAELGAREWKAVRGGGPGSRAPSSFPTELEAKGLGLRPLIACRQFDAGAGAIGLEA
jgi:hypothetical protein